MDRDLFNYMPIEEKLRRARKLLRSAFVYDHVKFLMTGKKEIHTLSDALKENSKNQQERKEFDKTRDIATVLSEENPHPDRLRNYKELCQAEILDMEYLLRDRKVRMQIVKDVMAEEQMDLKRDYSFFVKSVKARVCGAKPVRKINTFMVSLFSKIRGR